MTYQEVLENARAVLSKNCKACPVCNGKACGNHIPGPGAKGVGDTAIRNYEKWQDIRVNMDTIHPCVTPDTSLYLFGKTFPSSRVPWAPSLSTTATNMTTWLTTTFS